MLTGRQLDTAAANLLRSAELARVLAALDAARLPVWLLKGMGLLQTAYRAEYHRRPMGDTDLLVEPERLPAACAVLESLGYALYPSRGLLYRRLAANDFLIDLHDELDHLPPAELARVRERSLSIEVEGFPARVLAPDDELLYIACHMGLHHAYLTPAGLSDLDRLARGRLDYPSIARAARLLGLQAPVSEVLRLLVRRHATPLPPAFLAALSPHGPGRVAARCYRYVLERNQGQHGYGILLDVLFRGSAAERVRRLARYVFPGRAVIARRYGARRFALLRPWLLLRRAWWILRRLERRPVW